MHETCTSEALGHPPLIDTLENRTLHKLSLIYYIWWILTSINLFWKPLNRKLNDMKDYMSKDYWTMALNHYTTLHKLIETCFWLH
jgi:hypothetical protein